jgi:hypothetical protein
MRAAFVVFTIVVLMGCGVDVDENKTTQPTNATAESLILTPWTCFADWVLVYDPSGHCVSDSLAARFCTYGNVCQTQCPGLGLCPTCGDNVYGTLVTATCQDAYHPKCFCNCTCPG